MSTKLLASAELEGCLGQLSRTQRQDNAWSLHFKPFSGSWIPSPCSSPPHFIPFFLPFPCFTFSHPHLFLALYLYSIVYRIGIMTRTGTWSTGHYNQDVILHGMEKTVETGSAGLTVRGSGFSARPNYFPAWLWTQNRQVFQLCKRTCNTRFIFYEIPYF